jgi:Fic family protein
MPQHEEWLHRDVRVSRAASTTRIEGSALDEVAVGRLAARSIVRAANEDEQDNINALQAYEFIDFLSDQADIPVDELVIRQLNRYFIATATSTLTPGAYRKGQNSVGGYQPPDQGDVLGLMRSFALWLRQDDDGLHPAVKSGLAHLHLLAVHPFWDGNGRTSRGLETLLLQRSSFDFKKLLSLEATLLEMKDEYFLAISRSLGNRFQDGYDATPWLEFSTSALVVCSRSLVEQTTAWHKKMSELYSYGPEAGLSARQTNGLMYANQLGQITRGGYMEATGVSMATASRDLADLVAKGFLTLEGKTRDRVYRTVPVEQVKARP